MLTNTFAEFRPTLEATVDIRLFDEVIESYAVAAPKPEPAIYQATAAALGVARPNLCAATNASRS